MSQYVSRQTNQTNRRSVGVAPTDESQESLLSDEVKRTDTSLGGDYLNVVLLLFLYILQGIPLGLAGSIPLILSNRHVSYSQQAVFSFVSWPFSVKLIWAPIVDAIYCSRFGRRKTWLIPTQYAIGLFMIGLSYGVDSLLGDGSAVNIYVLTAVFFALNFLAATQDIAVDGWALTMLSRRNVSYASTCNSVGQTAGYFLGNVVFLALESPDLCNKYFRSEPSNVGLVTLSGFFFFWGTVFMFTTTIVMLAKRETVNQFKDSNEEEMTVLDTYRTLFRIFRLPHVRMITLILMTCKIGFAATDSATGLKLIEAGVHKENLALLAIPIVPLQIVLPWIISRYTNGPQPLKVFLRAYPYRLMFGIVFAGLLWWTKYVKLDDGSFPNYYYFVILVAYSLQQIALYSMFVALMAFYAQISDPLIGGTYMTLLNTLTNLGGNWPSTVALWLIDPLTFKSCSIDGLNCNDSISKQDCISQNGECNVRIDGYYVLVFICVILGYFWLKWGANKINSLQSLPHSVWKRI